MARADSTLRGRMVFLVGARRSGTNWLQHLLTLHPAIAVVPSETHLFSHGISAVADRVQHGLISSAKTGSVYVERERFLDATRDWCDAIFAPFLAHAEGASLLLERTPLHAKHLDLIASIYPDAYVLHLVRDGTAVALSLLAQEWGPDTISGAAREWAETVRAVREASVPKLLEIRHEQLAADPVAGVTAVWEWLGLDVDDTLPAAVRREADKPVNVTAGKAGTRTPGRLRRQDAAAVVTEAGAELSRLGYSLPSSRRRRSVSAALRKAAGEVRSRSRFVEWRPSTPSPALGGALWYEQSQLLVDELLTALETADVSRLAAVCAADVEVMVNGDRFAGEDARNALRAFMPVRNAQQLRAEVYPASPTFTVVLWHRADPRTVESRLLVITPGAERIDRVVAERLDVG